MSSVVQVDLGCGGAQRIVPGASVNRYIGIDRKGTSQTSYVVQLGFEPIPVPDSCADFVSSWDFIEHIPMQVWMQRGVKPEFGVQFSPMINLFNEVYRILKPRGIFYIKVPLFPSKGAMRDPTHVSYWTDETHHYFSGDYYGYHDHYGHTSDFFEESKTVENDVMQLRLIAHKPARKRFLALRIDQINSKGQET